jgi:hypothetical protein
VPPGQWGRSTRRHWRPTVPLPLLRPFAVLGRTAVDNARAAAAVVTEQVADRRELAPADAPGGRGSLARISRVECLQLLASRRVGRLAYVARQGVPDLVPVNYVLHEGHVLVRSGIGPKLQAAERGETMVLEVDDLDDETQTGWSVVAAGPARRLTVAEVHALPDSVLPRTWADGPRLAVLRIRPSRVEGRRLS